MTMNLCISPPTALVVPSAETAVVTNSRSPQMTGVPEPRPGSATFQRIFFVSDHSTGGFAVFETPVANGPRHCAQNRALSADCASIAGDHERQRRGCRQTREKLLRHGCRHKDT